MPPQDEIIQNDARVLFNLRATKQSRRGFAPNIQGEADARASGAQADEKERGKTRAESARAPPRREL